MAASGCLHFFSATKQNLWLHFEQDPLFVVEFWPLFWPSNNYKSFHTANKFIIALVSFCICDLTFLKTEVNFFFPKIVLALFGKPLTIYINYHDPTGSAPFFKKPRGEFSILKRQGP